MEKILCCEQCGAPLSRWATSEGCLRCLLQAGLEPNAVENANSPADFGTHAYHHYRILLKEDGSAWELGRGAMGVTYKAVDVNLQVPVALKVLNGRFSSLPGADDRFLHEAQAAAQLRHPNVASVFHFGVVNLFPDFDGPGSDPDRKEQQPRGDCFYAMEFVEGETLEALLRRRGRISPLMAVEIGLQVSRALAAAEKCGLVHRDIKPANIMLRAADAADGKDFSLPDSSEAWVKVIDFGLAQAAKAEEEGESANPARFLGTPEFASPEQLQGRRLDIRSDIYSLGATLWYGLTGTIANRSSGLGEQASALDLPSPVVALLESMLATDPDDRPASAAALSEALIEGRRAVTGETEPRARFFRGARKRTLTAAALLLAAVLGLFFYFFLPNPSTDDKSIAVLPFRNLSTDPKNDFFAEGIEDDIRSSLIKVRELKLIGRRSVAGLRSDVPRDLRTIGKALGARYVLQGSLRREGDRVLLNVDLVDTPAEQVVWAERYDRAVANAVDMQSDLAEAIVDALDATLSPQERVELDRKSTRNPDAYVLYLRALKFEDANAAAIADYEAAANLYTQALALDPGFALAHARLASRLAILYRFRGPSEELKLRAHAEARRALQLQPNLGEAHLAKGECFYHIERDFSRALPEFLTARNLLPNDPEPEAYMAFIHRRQGKWREARAGLQRVALRDPKNLTYAEELFATSTLLREWPDMVRYADHVVEVAPTLPQVQVERGYADIWQSGSLSRVNRFYANYKPYGDPEGDIFWGRWDVAMLDRDFTRAQAAIDAFPFATLSSFLSAPVPKTYFEGCIQLAQGNTVEALLHFEAARPQMEADVLAHPDNAIRHARLGLLYAYMGRKADAIREGERAVQLQPVSADAYDGPQRLCTLALIHARVGDNDKAISMIESLLRMPGCVSFYEASMSLSELRLRWQWDPLRSELRFQKILSEPEPQTIY
jgi:serine/threonine-protein kinase